MKFSEVIRDFNDDELARFIALVELGGVVIWGDAICPEIPKEVLSKIMSEQSDNRTAAWRTQLDLEKKKEDVLKTMV